MLNIIKFIKNIALPSVSFFSPKRYMWSILIEHDCYIVDFDNKKKHVKIDWKFYSNRSQPKPWHQGFVNSRMNCLIGHGFKLYGITLWK